MVRKWFTDVKSHPGYRTWVEIKALGKLQPETWIDCVGFGEEFWSYGIPNFQWWLSSNLDLERRNGPSHQQLQIYHPKDKRHGVVVKAACMQRKAILKYTDTKSYFKSLTYWYSPEYSGPNKNPALVDLRISQSCCVGILSLWWIGFLVNFHCKTRST